MKRRKTQRGHVPLFLFGLLRTGFLFFRRFFVASVLCLSSSLLSSPLLHHRKIWRRAAPRRGSQMNRFNEKMASRRGWEGKGRAAQRGKELVEGPPAEEEGCFSSLIRNHCMSRGSNEIAAIKMMPVYMPRVLGSRAGRGYKASSGFAHRRGTRYMIHCSMQHFSETLLINPHLRHRKKNWFSSSQSIHIQTILIFMHHMH